MARLRIFALALLAASMTTLAADFRVVTLVNEPYAYLQDDKPAGFSVDLIREMARRLHKTVAVDILPWARALSESRTGRADIILNVLRTPERETYLDYIPTAVTTEEAIFLVPTQSDIHFDGNLETLHGRVVGAGRGFRFGEPVDNAFYSGQLQREDQDTVAVMLQKLAIGRLQIGVVDKTLGEYELQRLGLTTQIKLLEPPMNHVPSFFAVSRAGKAAGWRIRLDQTLKQMYKDGSYARIRGRYVQESF